MGSPAGTPSEESPWGHKASVINIEAFLFCKINSNTAIIWVLPRGLLRRNSLGSLSTGFLMGTFSF